VILAFRAANGTTFPPSYCFPDMKTLPITVTREEKHHLDVIGVLSACTGIRVLSVFYMQSTSDETDKVRRSQTERQSPYSRKA
jgi:hypothetical protein